MQVLPLPRRAPDALEEAVSLGKPVHGVVRLAHGAHEAAEGIGLVLAGVAAVLVNLADAELDRGVVLGLDNAAGGAALAGDVDCEGLVSTGRVVQLRALRQFGGIQSRGIRAGRRCRKAYGRRARRVRSPW